MMSYGPDAVHELVVESGLSYPVSVRRLEREHALANIEIDEDGNSAMLAELLAETETDSFDSEADLRAALEPVIEREREARRTGIVGHLKRTFLGG